jgi:ATP:ADP antiporter, AAA family
MTNSLASLRARLQRPATLAVIVSFIFFFALIASFGMLRPVREEMVVRSGISNLPWLFTGTFIVMLVAMPIYGWFVSRHTRLRLLRGVYLFFIANLLIFYWLLLANLNPAITAVAFYIWISVFNLFVVSVFWTVMTDVFSRAESERLFGYIAAGGTVGAITGPAITAFSVSTIGIPNLLLISASLLLLPIAAITWLSRWAVQHGEHEKEAIATQSIGGNPLDGLRQIMISPVMRMLAIYFLLYVTLSTFLYFEQIRIVGETFKDSATRTAFFARIDVITNSLTLLLQLTITRYVMSRIGIFRSLLVLPLFTLLGFIALAISPTLMVLAGVIIMRRALDFTIARPSREAIFTLVSASERYKAKNVMDTTIYRGGDALSAWFVASLKSLIGAGAALAVAALPITLAWLAVTGWLARVGNRQEALSSASTFANTSSENNKPT